MKTLYIECNMGMAGDMLTGALLEIYGNEDEFLKEINDLIPGVKVSVTHVAKRGIMGTKAHITLSDKNDPEKFYEEGVGGVNVHKAISADNDHAREYTNSDGANRHGHDDPNNAHMHEHTDSDSACHHEHSDSDNNHHHEHHHMKMDDIYKIVDKMWVSEKVKSDIKKVYGIIARAESMAHGVKVEEVHLHEVGAMDAVADITGCMLLLNKINPDRVVVSPVTMGYGTVRCAHGIMPVPAPATAHILEGVPTKAGAIEGELCTPTGAALLKYIADEFAWQPEMTVEKLGYGMGDNDYDAPNCVRAMFGISHEKDENITGDEKTDDVAELCCDIDDMTGEEIGYAVESIRKGAALDVHTESIYMKKFRPGTKLTVLCSPRDVESVVKDIFSYTTTIGIRKYDCGRYVLNRGVEKRDTKYGSARVKKSDGYGITREKAEYDDIKDIADKTGKSLRDIRKEIE